MYDNHHNESEVNVDASKPLKNARHEVFAQHLANGKAQAEAYTAAGYANTRAARFNASRLISRDNVSARANYLKTKAAEKALVTAEGVLRGLRAEAEYRDEGTSHSARVAAWAHLGKHLGMFSEKAEHTGDIAIRIIRE